MSPKVFSEFKGIFERDRNLDWNLDWNRLPYNLYCVGRDVKHCSIQSNTWTGNSLLENIKKDARCKSERKSIVNMLQILKRADFYIC